MSDKQQLLAELREIFDRWETLLSNLSEDEITTPQLPGNWAIKDMLVHLWAWQQRSIARMDAARLGGEPQFPRWSPEHNPSNEEDTDPVNAWIYETYRERAWADVQRNWRESLLHFVEQGEAVPEPELFDSKKYAWLEGYALSEVLQGSLEHHQEHYEILTNWLTEHGKLPQP